MHRKVTIFNIDQSLNPTECVKMVNRLSQNNLESFYMPELTDAVLKDNPIAQNAGWGFFELSSVRSAKVLLINNLLNNIATGSSQIA